MLKFVVLCVLLWHETCELSSRAEQRSSDTSILNFPTPVLSKINSTDVHTEVRMDHQFHAAHRICCGNSTFLGGAAVSRNLNSTDNISRAGYLVTNGIGAHKLHRNVVKWSEARQHCVDEGGHLAVIRSQSEEEILLKMMNDPPVNWAWIGFHDQFEEGNWISVFDEPFGKIGWGHWSKKLANNPDNSGGNQNCGQLVKNGGGMDDFKCDAKAAFICKISIF